MIGTRISAYEILSELGSGGMGSVYLAECVEETAETAGFQRISAENCPEARLQALLTRI